MGGKNGKGGRFAAGTFTTVLGALAVGHRARVGGTWEGLFTRCLNKKGISGTSRRHFRLILDLCSAASRRVAIPAPVCVLIAEAAVPVLFRLFNVPLLCISKCEWDTRSSIGRPHSVFTIGEPHLNIFLVLHGEMAWQKISSA